MALGPSQELVETPCPPSQALFFQPLPQAQPGAFRIAPLALGTKRRWLVMRPAGWGRKVGEGGGGRLKKAARSVPVCGASSGFIPALPKAAPCGSDPAAASELSDTREASCRSVSEPGKGRGRAQCGEAGHEASGSRTKGLSR